MNGAITNTINNMNQNHLPNLVLCVPEKSFFASREVVTKLVAFNVCDQTSTDYQKTTERGVFFFFTTGRTHRGMCQIR